MLNHYIEQASDYVKATELTPSESKCLQIKLSAQLSQVILKDLGDAGAPLCAPKVGEIAIAGGMRTAQADLADFDPRAGLLLGVEVKPMYRAARRSIWNRFGDVSFFSSNVHLRSPYAVLGALLVLPTWSYEYADSKVTTSDMVARLELRFDGVGRRKLPHDPVHLLEAMGILLYDPDTQAIVPTNWSYDRFIEDLVTAMNVRGLA